MKRTAFLAVALLALMAVGLYAQTEADFDTDTSSDGKSITITKYKGKVTEVKIPEKIKNLPVTVIGDSAFRRTTITSVTIPSSVTEIDHWGFNQCVLLTSITIPKTITKIGNEAFYRCSNLTSVMFEGTIASSEFDGKAFDGDLRDKFYATDKAKGTPGTYTTTDTSNINSKWTKSASATSAPAAAGTAGLAFTAINNNKEYSVAKGTVKSGVVVIPASYNNLPVSAIFQEAFSGTTILEVTIPASVITIGANAFANCPGLTSVTFGCTLPPSDFDENAFRGLGDIRAKYFAAGGGAGTYTRLGGGSTWTKK